MAKKESTIVNMVLTLFIVTGVAAAALGFIYEQTKDPIAKAEKDYLYKQINIVVPGAAEAEISNYAAMPASGPDSLIFYKVIKEGNLIGTAVQSYTDLGFSGRFSVIVGFDDSGTIIDANVLSHKETPGLGDKMDKSKSTWNNQFKSFDPGKTPLVVVKDKGTVDAITAATISSRAFCDALKRAHETFMNNKTNGGNK